MNKPTTDTTKPFEPKDLAPLFWAGFRIFVYAAAMLITVLCLTWEAQNAPAENLFSERSLLESLQEIFLFLTALICLLIALTNTKEKALATLLGGAATVAFIREFDFFLDEHVFDGAWQMMVLATFIIIAIILYRLRPLLLPSITRFLKRPSFGIMVSGFLIVFVYSRMFGRNVLWQAVMGDGYIRAVKNAAEEGTELLGYLLILIAVIELFFECRRLRRD